MLYSCMTNAFHFALRSRSGWKSAETGEECLNLRMFSSLGSFLQFFLAGQGVTDIKIIWNK